MGTLAEKLEEVQDVQRLTIPVSPHVVDLNNYLASTSRSTKPGPESEEAAPLMFWSRHRDDNGARESLSEHKRQAESPIDETPDERSSLSPYFTAAILLGLLSAAAVFYGTGATGRKAVAAQNPEAQPLSAVTISAVEMPSQKDDSIPSLTGDPTSEQESWTDTLSLYQRFVARQNKPIADEHKQAENDRLLRQFEGWMNKDAR